MRSNTHPAFQLSQTLLTAGQPLSEEFIQRAKSLQVNYIGCQLSGTSRTMVKEAQKQGFKVNCWPGHKVEDYYLCLGLGVDVHCTDIPMAVLKVKAPYPMELSPEGETIAKQLDKELTPGREARAMFDAIMEGQRLTPRNGWFATATSQTRYSWPRTLERYDQNKDGAVEPSELPIAQRD